MRIIRHTAPDTRQALRGIREQLGDDAVILSSKRTPEGVEVTAAVDFDATRLENAAVPLAPPAAAKRPAAPSPAPPARAAQTSAPAPAARIPAPQVAARDPAIATVAAQLRAPAAAPAARAPAPVRAPAPARRTAPVPIARTARAPVPVTPTAPARTTAPAAPSVPAPAPAPAVVAAPAAMSAPAAAAMDHMNSELKILRRMLETQLEQLAWNERTRRTPVVAEMLRELTEMGIAQDLAERIGEQLPADVDLSSARRFAIAGLSQYLRTAGPRWQDDGGRVALVGATGVGKTTSLAKLAVRWVLRHGARDLALVAADSVRIGAQDQLQSLGQLLGAPVYVPDDFNGLGALLTQLARFRLILIDTPGASVRDPQ